MHTMYLDISVPRIVITKLLGRFWPGAYFGIASPLFLKQMPDPPLPASDWVRVQNQLCGICGSDLHQIFVDASLDVAPTALPAHKRIYLGHEMVGTVIETGTAVTDFKPGDRVVRWGRADDCMARGRKVLCPPCRQGHRVLCEYASEPKTFAPIGGGFSDSFITPASTLVPILPGLSDSQAIFVEPGAVAIHAAWRQPAQPGDKVLVVGCGTIGFLLIQAVRTLQPDCEITAVAEFPWQAKMAHQFGANHTFLATEDGYTQTRALTGARLYQGRAQNQMLIGGFDLVFDVVGVSATLNNALRWTRAGGSVVLVGVNLHRMQLDISPIWYQEVNLLGAVGHDVVSWQNERISTFELAMRWMLDGVFQLDGLLTHCYPLEAYRQAFATALDKRHQRSVKVAFQLAPVK